MFVTGARGNTIRKLKFKDFRVERGSYVLQYHETKTNKVSVTEIPEELYTDVMLFKKSKCSHANSQSSCEGSDFVFPFKSNSGGTKRIKKL